MRNPRVGKGGIDSSETVERASSDADRDATVHDSCRELERSAPGTPLYWRGERENRGDLVLGGIFRVPRGAVEPRGEGLVPLQHTNETCGECRV